LLSCPAEPPGRGGAGWARPAELAWLSAPGWAGLAGRAS